MNTMPALICIIIDLFGLTAILVNVYVHQNKFYNICQRYYKLSYGICQGICQIIFGKRKMPENMINKAAFFDENRNAAIENRKKQGQAACACKPAKASGESIRFVPGRML